MTDRGVLLFDEKEPKISGYLILGGQHYQIIGERISAIRTNLHLRKTSGGTETQEDLFDEPSQPSD